MVEKERREEDEARHRRMGHAGEVRTQIREKEQQRIMERNAFFEEGVRLDEEARTRRHKLEEIKRNKLQELRYVVYHYFNFMTSSKFTKRFPAHGVTHLCSDC